MPSHVEVSQDSRMQWEWVHELPLIAERLWTADSFLEERDSILQGFGSWEVNHKPMAGPIPRNIWTSQIVVDGLLIKFGEVKNGGRSEYGYDQTSFYKILKELIRVKIPTF